MLKIATGRSGKKREVISACVQGVGSIEFRRSTSILLFSAFFLTKGLYLIQTKVSCCLLLICRRQ